MNNREIKFRAWLTLSDYDDDGNDRDYYGMATSISVHHGGDIGFSVDEGHHTFGGDIFERALDNGTVSEYEEWCLWEGRFELMQYTGLNDKNGVEMYEGDIVSYLSPYSFNRERLVGEIYFYQACFSIRPTDKDFYSRSLWRSYKNCEVIGNIYENPELLKEAV